MRVLMVGNMDVIHTTRWANGLALRGHDVHLASFRGTEGRLLEGLTLHLLDGRPGTGYFLAANHLRRLAQRIEPDVVNPHYASGYGTLARLAEVGPSLLSVWGSDVYDFPRRSSIHRWWLRKNLAVADVVGSTSHAMAREMGRTYRHPRVVVTPFGIDETRFKREETHREEVVIGTVKTLAPTYGIDVLIRAFARAVTQLETDDPALASRLRLEITGTGEQSTELEYLANDLGLGSRVRFLGPVPHERVPERLSRLDIYVALSRVESFGVAVLEASACELPVLVSDADGLREVTDPGVTGLVVPREDVGAAAAALVKLAQDPSLRRELGRNGRERVKERYTWNRSLDIMTEALEWTASRRASAHASAAPQTDSSRAGD